MKEIALTQGMVTLVDDDDYIRFCDVGWTYSGGYAVKYACGLGTRLLHREIMNCPKGMVVDHINRDKLDNRKENLRIVTIRLNIRNQKQHKNNTSGYTGVSRDKRTGRFEAYIWDNRRKIHLGMFSTPEEAAQAYNCKAEELGYLTKNVINWL